MRISDQAYNRHKILKAIRGQGPISRTELTMLTGLSGATITEITADLLERGLVCEHRGPATGRGRPRTQLSIDPQGGLVIGATLIDNGVISSSFVDLAGERLFSSEKQMGARATLHEYANAIADVLGDAIAASPFEPGAIDRIALTLPALVDSQTGVVHWMTTFDEPPCPFAEIIAERLDIPVTVENDSPCLARAEHWFGKARSLDDFSLFHVGVWLDGAQYVDGLPRLGANGFNAEAGHVKTDLTANARTCVCGSKGCVAVYGTIYGVLLGSGRLADFDIRSPFGLGAAFRQLADEAQNGDGEAARHFVEAGEHLGVAIANHINAFDPANVFVLMTERRFMDLVTPALIQSVARNVFKPLGERTTIEVAMVEDDWRWKGTAAHALEQTYLGENKRRTRKLAPLVGTEMELPRP
ncbi:MAG: ROK family transcriptional regulator [Novosphingobium sp.]|nr:ROK family transcriptional regulator [Novosphingobium sp.]